MKKMVAMGTGTLICCLALAIPAFAAMTADSAKAAAEKYVPRGSVYAETKIDDGKYEIKFYSGDRLEKYEIEISQSSEKPVKYESELVEHRGGLKTVITEETAQKAVTDEIKNAEILLTIVEYDDGYSRYAVSFKTAELYGSYEIQPETGKIMKREIYMGTLPTAPALKVDPVTGDIGIDKAREIALAKVPGAQVQKLQLEHDDGRAVYEGELRNGKWEYDFEIDAATGAILEWDQDYDD